MIRRPLAVVRDLLYTERCIHCGRFGQVLCSVCRNSLMATDGAKRCKNCAAKWDEESNCPRCYFWDSIDSAATAHAMKDIARSVVHGLKYSYIESLAPVMSLEIRPMP